MKKQIFITTIILSTIVSFASSFKIKESKNDYSKIEFSRAKDLIIDGKVLLGNWTRTDSEYKIKISEVVKGGKLKAGYFNPKSINVSKGSWTNTKGVLKIYIELRDENYPGSNYNLTYYPEKDMLSGKYFQAVTGETYDILFTRIK